MGSVSCDAVSSDEAVNFVLKHWSSDETDVQSEWPLRDCLILRSLLSVLVRSVDVIANTVCSFVPPQSTGSQFVGERSFKAGQSRSQSSSLGKTLGTKQQPVEVFNNDSSARLDNRRRDFAKRECSPEHSQSRQRLLNRATSHIRYAAVKSSVLSCAARKGHDIRTSFVEDQCDTCSLIGSTNANKHLSCRSQSPDSQLRTSSTQAEEEDSPSLLTSSRREVRQTSKFPPDVRDDSCRRSNKSSSSKVRQKRDRLRLLDGHDCPECRQFYANSKLSNDQIAKLIDKCSRHRTTRKAKIGQQGEGRHQLQDSPRVPWSLDISIYDDEHGMDPRMMTQVSTSPLRTLKRRRDAAKNRLKEIVQMSPEMDID